MIRLLDGSRAYLHAIIDNFSRRILSWKVNSTFDPATTAEILLAASQAVGNDKPMLLTDGGVENVNGAVDELVELGLLKRVLAQTEITFSNSLIESWWRVLKHQWLYLNTLDTVRTVEKLVAFYVHFPPTHGETSRGSRSQGTPLPARANRCVWISHTSHLRRISGQFSS